MTTSPAVLRRLFLALPLVALAACADSDDAPEAVASGEPEPGGTVVIAEAADLGIPSPIVAQTELDGNLSSDVMYMALLRGRWEDGRLAYGTADESPMALARSYEYVGPDSTAIRFHMRSDRRWSDGAPITAEDVAFTYGMIQESELASPRSDVVAQIDSVVAENDSTVLFQFRSRYADMLFHSAVGIIPAHVFEGTEPAAFRSHPALQNPAGNLVVSGPFMIGEWRKGQQITMVPNPHFRPRPHLERIVFRIIPESTTRLAELRTGAVDFVKGVPFDQIPSLREQAPHVGFEFERQRNYDYIAYGDQEFPAFADPEIRRALGLAIDVPRMIEGLQMGEFAEPAGGPYAPIFSDLYDPNRTPPLEFAPDRARQILEAKGWVDEDGDGIREKDGTPFRFTLVTNSGNQRRADAAQIVQRQWRAVGVQADIRTLEFNTFFTNLVEHSYEAALGGWIVALSPDITQLFASDGGYNITGFSDPEADSLFRRALEQPTPETAAPYWRRAAAQVVEGQPYTWLYFLDTVDAVNERLRGATIDTYGPLQNTWEWWIPRASQRGGGATRPAGDTAAADTAS